MSLYPSSSQDWYENMIFSNQNQGFNQNESLASFLGSLKLIKKITAVHHSTKNITATSPQQLYLKFGATLRPVERNLVAALLGLKEAFCLEDGWFQEARFCQATPESNCCLLCWFLLSVELDVLPLLTSADFSSLGLRRGVFGAEFTTVRLDAVSLDLETERE